MIEIMPKPFVREEIDTLIARHGRLKVLLATLKASLRRPTAPGGNVHSHEMSNHLRRDIGLPESAAPPPILPPRIGPLI